MAKISALHAGVSGSMPESSTKNKFGYFKLMLYICIPMKKFNTYYSSLSLLLSKTQAGKGV